MRQGPALSAQGPETVWRLARMRRKALPANMADMARSGTSAGLFSVRIVITELPYHTNADPHDQLQWAKDPQVFFPCCQNS